MNPKQPLKQLLFKYFSNNLTTSVLRPCCWFGGSKFTYALPFSCFGVFGFFSSVVIMCIKKQEICSFKVFFPV